MAGYSVAKARYLEKRKVIQKVTLDCLHVKTLERIVLEGTVEYSEFDRHCAEFFRYTLYSFSDAQASTNLMLDVTDGDDGLYGFLEARDALQDVIYLGAQDEVSSDGCAINGLLDESFVTGCENSCLTVGSWRPEQP